jgi:hypothetical protein
MIFNSPQAIRQTKAITHDRAQSNNQIVMDLDEGLEYHLSDDKN